MCWLKKNRATVLRCRQDGMRLEGRQPQALTLLPHAINRDLPRCTVAQQQLMGVVRMRSAATGMALQQRHVGIQQQRAIPGQGGRGHGGIVDPRHAWMDLHRNRMFR
ncbi:hypothetical protein G6F57_021316 [Rhizopus arrhizus]|nr:hypothetical protein G6F57_021316 [Rhizopus arrhizus]